MLISKPRSTTVLQLMYASLFVVQLVSAQTSPLRIPGVDEPPELTGEPRKVKPFTETQRQFGEIVRSLNEKDQQKIRATIQGLSKFIEQHPDYPDAYLIRATLNLCTLNSRDYPGVQKDIDTAVSTHSGQTTESMYEKLDYYALRGRVKFLSGHYRDALDDMESAIKADFLSADNVFNVEGVEPEQKSSRPCTWSLSDFDSLAAALPNDYRERYANHRCSN